MRKLDPPVRAALRLGAYQLGFVDGVPRYAAVNESVELVRAAGLERAVAFTNAVLRRLADGIEPLLAALPEETAREAALAHSYPDWIAETWWRDLGAEDARALMRAQNEPAELAVRLVRGEIDGEPTDVPGAWRVERIDEAALAEGRIWPQSRASQLVGLAVGAREGERTLDLCAAPGGKATMLAGEVVAVDVNEARARELEEIAARLGASNVRVVVADGRELPPELDGFDRALVDAPCSGLGVLNSRPGPPLARGAAARAPARAPARGRRARAAGRDDRLLGLHDQRGRGRGCRRCVWPRGRCDARGRVAAVPSPGSARVPADAPARARDRRLLRGAAHRALRRDYDHALRGRRELPGARARSSAERGRARISEADRRRSRRRRRRGRRGGRDRSRARAARRGRRARTLRVSVHAEPRST